MNGQIIPESRQEYWRQILEDGSFPPLPPIRANRFQKGWRTKSEPVLLHCEDGNIYVVKGQQAGRQIINDQIVARLGLAIAAPVGKPEIIDVPQELIAIEPKNLARFRAGTAHGTLFIPDCMDTWDLIATSEPENRRRLASLAILYGWVGANDHQFLFRSEPPRFIYSVDHGHFFPNGPEWTITDLQTAQPAMVDSDFSECNFSSQELAEVKQRLDQVSENTILEIVQAPPLEWGLTLDERVNLVQYLITRQQQLLKCL